MDFSCIYLSKYKKGNIREYKIVNRKRWRFIIIDMRHLLLWKEVRRKEKRKGKKGKKGEGEGESEAKCSNRVAANSTLGVFNSSLFPLHLFSSLFVLLFLLLLLLSQILRELKSCHIEEFVERRYRFHQTRNEVGSRTLAIG